MQDRTQASLFDLGGSRTIRDVASAVRRQGLGALSATRRADDVRYQEVRCQTALNRVDGMPFRWTLNPYRGCTHGCHYCFARRYQSHLELGAGDQFSSVVLVKANFADVLARELARPGWNRDGATVALGTATDPYQPIEGHYRLTRRTLQALVDHPSPVSLVTRGPLAVRDTDLLLELSRRTRCTVTFSVPTVDEDAWRRLEPGAPPPRQRLEAVQRLRRAGVDAGVLMAPIVPGITSHPALLDRTLRAIQDHGAGFVGASLLHLDGATRDHFLTVLGRCYPHLVERYGRLYAGKHAAPDYAARFRHVVGALRARYDLERRSPEPPSRAPAAPPGPAQSRLALEGVAPVRPALQPAAAAGRAATAAG